MSRLRRIALSDRFFFVTCRISRGHRLLSERDFMCLADAVHSRRAEFGFALAAWVFLPNHWHAIFFPRHPVTISTAMKAIKVSAAVRINAANDENGPVWQSRFFDRMLRTVKEYRETVEYIHWNPVKAGLATRPEDWEWSSAREYGQRANAKGRLMVDRIELPSDERMRI
jgi:REP-associated tyrosine transposase